MERKRAYLDTHLIVWLFMGNKKIISSKVIDIINSSELFFSPIVKLELQLLYEIEKLNHDSDEIINDLTSRIALKECEESFSGIISNSIKVYWTRDPFDRLIVSNASLNKSMLLTKDRTILENYDLAVWN